MVMEFPTLTSTNDYCKNLLLSLPSFIIHSSLPPLSLVAIRADTQKKGRGQGTNKWISKKGGLYCSFATTITRLESTASLTSSIADLLLRFFNEQYSLRLAKKGINDLFFAGKKLGGVLIERIIRGNELVGVVIGIGINILNPSESFPDYSSITLKEIGIQTTPRKLFYNLIPYIHEFVCEYL